MSANPKAAQHYIDEDSDWLFSRYRDALSKVQVTLHSADYEAAVAAWRGWLAAYLPDPLQRTAIPPLPKALALMSVAP